MAIDPMIALSRATPEGEAEYQVFVSQLRQYWSDLEAIPRQPSLAKFDVQNGVWTIGRRAYHTDTGTYLTYLVYRQGFIPFIFLGAYRVCETSRGTLVFIGRHPLPAWARALNAVGVVALGGLAYLAVHIILEMFR